MKLDDASEKWLAIGRELRKAGCLCAARLPLRFGLWLRHRELGDFAQYLRKLGRVMSWFADTGGAPP